MFGKHSELDSFYIKKLFKSIVNVKFGLNRSLKSFIWEKQCIAIQSFTSNHMHQNACGVYTAFIFY